MDIVVRDRVAAGIPLLELCRADDGKRPLVLLYHGYLGRKEFILAQAYYLAAQGFFVVAPDAFAHGGRAVPGDALSQPSAAGFIECVTRTSAEINTLLESCADDARADVGRVGLAGYSMGGCITFDYLMGSDRRVTAAASVIGSPDWVSVMRAASAQGLLPDTPEDIAARVRVTHPAAREDGFTPLPLLMLAGTADTLVPPEGVKGFYERNLSRYEQPERLCLKLYDNVGHNDTVEMNMELAQWMTRYLHD